MKVRVVPLLFLLIIVVTPCARGVRAVGQEPPPRTDDQRQRSNEIATLINNALSAPPEFAADVLIRIVESGKILDRKKKCNLLQEAFSLAQAAQQPVKLKGLPGSMVDTRSGYLARSFENRLDTLSLQIRVVKAMLSLDKDEARELFNDIQMPSLAPLSCDDALVYDVSEFYKLLTVVSQTTFSLKEVRLNEHIRFVEKYVEAISSPVQVGPILKAILSLKTSAFQLELLAHAFSRALERVSGDDRTFSFSLFSQEKGVAGLMELCKERNILCGLGLLTVSREYFARHLSGPRCSDNVGLSETSLADEAFTSFFRNLVHELDPSGKTLIAISDDDIKPSKIEGSASIHRYWVSNPSSRLLEDLKALRFSSSGEPVSVTDKENPEWQSRLRDFVSTMDEWREGEEEPEVDYFHHKCAMFEGLLDLLQNGPEHDEVLTEFAAFLRKPAIEEGSRIEWFLHANYLINRVRSSQGYERAKVLRAISGTGDPNLQLYTDLVTTLPNGKPATN